MPLKGPLQLLIALRVTPCSLPCIQGCVWSTSSPAGPHRCCSSPWIRNPCTPARGDKQNIYDDSNQLKHLEPQEGCGLKGLGEHKVWPRTTQVGRKRACPPWAPELPRGMQKDGTGPPKGPMGEVVGVPFLRRVNTLGTT